jgi:hypothetical protein
MAENLKTMTGKSFEDTWRKYTAENLRQSTGK